MPTLPLDREHPQPTERSGYRYLFTVKHHGHAGHPRDAQWSPGLTLDQEFSVFNGADRDDISDAEANLYGALREGDIGLLPLGTWGQLVARFPVANEGQPWHGYPLGPLSGTGPENRRGDQFKAPKEVFRKMELVNLITEAERRRLEKGKHV
jgi:hypothetical protein